ncbi:MAG: GatB/YqeY domain-containing protein [Thermomicrobiales bacterium]
MTEANAPETSALRARLEADMKQAMRDRDNETRDAVRYILAMVKTAEIDKRSPLTEEEGIALLRTQVKQRQDSIEQFRNGGRDDLADREEAQVTIIERYLPQQMTDDELAAFVMQGIAEAGATTPKDMGKVMGLLNRQANGRVDGRRLSAVVKEALAAL